MIIKLETRDMADLEVSHYSGNLPEAWARVCQRHGVEPSAATLDGAYGEAIMRLLSKH